MTDIIEDIDFDNIGDGNVASPATPRAAVLQSPGSPGSVLSGKTNASGLSGRVRDSTGSFKALCDTGHGQEPMLLLWVDSALSIAALHRA